MAIFGIPYPRWIWLVLVVCSEQKNKKIFFKIFLHFFCDTITAVRGLKKLSIFQDLRGD